MWDPECRAIEKGVESADQKNVTQDRAKATGGRFMQTAVSGQSISASGSRVGR